MASNKAADLLPADALMIQSVLQSMGVKDYDARVIHQLLDFMYRNVADVLQVAEAFSDRAGARSDKIGLDDVMLAIQAKAATSFVVPPSQEMLQAMAERRNSVALPSTATAKYGFRLPPAEDCLIAPNIQFRPRDPPQHVDWEDEVISAGVGTEPYNAPPAVSLRKTADLGKQHPAFQSSDQEQDLQQATAGSTVVLEQAVANMDTG